MIVILAVFLKNIVLLTVLVFISNSIVFLKSFLIASAVSIIGTGLITPVLISLFNRLGDIHGREAGTPASEEL